MNSITIKDIPIPPSGLNPNNTNTHRMKKAGLIADQRAAACVYSQIAVYDMNDWRSAKFPWNKVASQVVWYRKERRIIDADNALASLKSTFDGIVDSGVLGDDKALIHLPIVFEYDKDNPRIEITLTKTIDGVCPLCKSERGE